MDTSAQVAKRPRLPLTGKAKSSAFFLFVSFNPPLPTKGDPSEDRILQLIFFKLFFLYKIILRVLVSISNLPDARAVFPLQAKLAPTSTTVIKGFLRVCR